LTLVDYFEDSGGLVRYSWNHMSNYLLSCGASGGDAVESISILLVEDEAVIQTMMEAELIAAGFAVSVASRGKQALTMLESMEADYRALVVDIHLGDDPTTTGWDVARHARELQPDLPVVYITGGGADEWTSLGVPNSMLVKKPFAPAQVITAVSQLLNQGNTPGA
jgi:DNA-binding response OmpR family regulator